MTDRLLRETFEQLADDSPPPAGLARAALAGARRHHRARVGAGVGLVVCAALAAGLAVSGDRGTQVASGLGDTAVLAYSGIRDPAVEDASWALLYSLLLDPDSGEYRRVNYPVVVPSPDGGRVLVVAGDNSARHPTRVGVMERSTGAIRWMTDEAALRNAGEGVWSPDGRRIAFRVAPKTGSIGVIVVDAENLRGEFVPLPDLREGDVRVAWTPSGDGFAVTLARSTGESSPYEAVGVRFYDLDGRPRRTLDVPDPELWAAPIFSAGGQLALSGPPRDQLPLSIAVVDPETGAVRSRCTLPLGGQLLGWADEDHLVVRTADPRGEREQVQVIDLAGRVTRSVTPPHGLFAQQIYVGPGF